MLQLSQIGYLSALPYLVNFLLVFPISYSAERVVQIQLMNVKTQRKLYNTIGCSGAALGLALLALTKCDAVLAVAALCMVMAFLAFNIPGCFVRNDRHTIKPSSLTSTIDTLTHKSLCCSLPSLTWLLTTPVHSWACSTPSPTPWASSPPSSARSSSMET